MKSKISNTLVMGLLALAIMPNAFGSGDKVGGGGGKKEPLFEEVANNIAEWIRSGNADQISSLLPQGVSLQQYKNEMLAVIGNYHVTFTDDRVLVNGFEKTCRSYLDERGVNQILCNNLQFGSDTPGNINEIYRQVHHEFAGLACAQETTQTVCLEQNRNEDSDYRISRLISGFLRNELVTRLPVVPSSSTTDGQQSLVGNITGCFGDLPGRGGKIVFFRSGVKLQETLGFTVLNGRYSGFVFLVTGRPGSLNKARLDQETYIGKPGVYYFAQDNRGWISVVVNRDYRDNFTAQVSNKDLGILTTLTCSTDVDVVSKALNAASSYSPM
jgi:hypothetical protein